MPCDYARAWLWITAIAGDPNIAIIDFRAIHDVDKGVPGIPFRGTLPDCWRSIEYYNGQGYGIFAVVSAMDGVGRELGNVHSIRAHYVDLDNDSAQQNYEAAARSWPSPALGVCSSPGRYHVYWSVVPYTGNDYFQLIQRKLRQVYDADKRIIDATRVMRLPGTLHQKVPSTPHMVTCWPLAGAEQRHDVTTLETALAGVNVIDGAIGTRHDLGEPELAAPSLDWLRRALELVNPNDLDRGDWIAITAAIKQSGWSLTDPDTLFNTWSAWCAKYDKNDLGENLKQWNSIRNSELGWQSLVRRVPSLQANMTLPAGGSQMPAVAMPVANFSGTPDGGVPPMPELAPPPPLDCSSEILTHIEQQTWFDGCLFVSTMGRILTPHGRYLGPTEFNGTYGGKKFITDGNGKITNEPWQAATRSTLWTVPKVDHTRFLPNTPHQALVRDVMGRTGVNVYKPLDIRRVQGDASPFLWHLAALLPEAIDQKLVLDFLAHNVKFPGDKIPWAPVIQSGEGAGKGILKVVMSNAMGAPYCYYPNAKELTNSGSQFNAWMRNKLFILADEIKVDDRRDLIEVLKPMISETMIEIQSKGHDQQLEDNFSNWAFFTNWKDAIPINKNSRRFAIFYSPLQTKADIIARGMSGEYFDTLYKWINADGAAIVTDFLMNYPIERGAVPQRAPDTSTTSEAVTLSRSPIERVIVEALEDALPGFRGGWISSLAVMARLRVTGAVRGNVSPQIVGQIVESMGYVACGRAARPYFAEDKDSRAYLWKFGAASPVIEYGPAQGWSE